MYIDPKSERSAVPASEKWSLSDLYTSDSAWEEEFTSLKDKIQPLEAYKGTLHRSANVLRNFLDAKCKAEICAEKLGHYSFLRLAEDMGNSESQARQGRFVQLVSQLNAALSFETPEIQAIEGIEEWLALPELENYRISIGKIIRYKPHILSEPEEKLLAMQLEMRETAERSFDALMDVDIDFGTVRKDNADAPLTHGTYPAFMQNPDRSLRSETFNKFFGQFEAHQNTLASLYKGSIDTDLYLARARNFPNSLEAALFPDNVDVSVYRNLVQTIHENLPLLHSYYQLRKRVQGIADYSLIDTRVPLTQDISIQHSYEEAVDVCIQSLAPLGNEYTSILEAGLRGTGGKAWVDKYENKGKQSGAFSAGNYSGHPHILMNYKTDLLRDLFTLAHESGHAMHSVYSARNNHFSHYNYTIFEAEVASTFNEQLLFHFMLKRENNEKRRSFLLNRQIDDIIGTIFRQTMFAEFELRCHELAEGGEALSIQVFREEYLALLGRYFGSEVAIPELAGMEGLRIPHFYRAFYVYKYATGLSAAISLSQQVLGGGRSERDKYFSFLESGGSRFPIESLAGAGVDMSSPEPIRNAMKVFKDLLGQLEQLL